MSLDLQMFLFSSGTVFMCLLSLLEDTSQIRAHPSLVCLCLNLITSSRIVFNKAC